MWMIQCFGGDTWRSEVVKDFYLETYGLHRVQVFVAVNALSASNWHAILFSSTQRTVAWLEALQWQILHSSYTKRTNTEKNFKTNLANKLRFALESKRSKAERKICLPLTCLRGQTKNTPTLLQPPLKTNSKASETDNTWNYMLFKRWQIMSRFINRNWHLFRKQWKFPIFW